MQTHGGDIYTRTYQYDFSTNINPFGMPDAVRQAAIRGIEASVHYPDVECRELRKAISAKEDVPMDWILCGNGAAELLFSLVLAKQPKKALLVSPCFAEYEQALRTTDCQIIFYELKKELGFCLDDSYLELLDPSVEIAFLCSPNNPTGQLIQPELLDKILRRCQEAHIFLVLDECFLDFVPQKLQNSAKNRLAQMPALFLLKAFTKMYGMPGLRLGYGLCSDAALLSRMKQMQQPWNVSLPAQLAGIAACQEQAFVEKTRTYLVQERDWLEAQLRALKFTVYPSAANYLLFEGPETLYERCADADLLIRDCSNYRGLCKGYYRIAVKSHEENEQLIKRLYDINR